MEETNSIQIYGHQYKIIVKMAPHLQEKELKVFADKEKREFFILAGQKVLRSELQKAILVKVKQIAKEILTSRTRVLAAQVGYAPKRLAIKDTRTRWGSCSSLGNINLSWRLILAPPEHCDYVIFHELAHLKHHDHSSLFWNFLRSVCPYYVQSQHWFRENGHTLHKI